MNNQHCHRCSRDSLLPLGDLQEKVCGTYGRTEAAVKEGKKEKNCCEELERKIAKEREEKQENRQIHNETNSSFPLHSSLLYLQPIFHRFLAATRVVVVIHSFICMHASQTNTKSLLKEHTSKAFIINRVIQWRLLCRIHVIRNKDAESICYVYNGNLKTRSCCYRTT